MADDWSKPGRDEVLTNIQSKKTFLAQGKVDSIYYDIQRQGNYVYLYLDSKQNPAERIIVERFTNVIAETTVSKWVRSVLLD